MKTDYKLRNRYINNIHISIILLILCLSPLFTYFWSRWFTSNDPTYYSWSYHTLTNIAISVTALSIIFFPILIFITVRKWLSFSNIIEGNYLISWHLEGDELKFFKENEFKIEITNRIGYVYTMAIMLFVASLIIFAIDEERSFSIFFFIMSTALSVGVFLFIKIRGIVINKRMKDPIGLFYLGDWFLVYNTEVYEFNSNLFTLVSIGIEEIDSKLMLEIVFAANGYEKIPEYCRTLKVPIPRDEEESFRGAIESIVATINGEETKYYQKDLISTKINVIKEKSGFLKLAITLVAFASVAVTISYFIAKQIYYNSYY